MLSRFALDGWQGHLLRTRRWFDRLLGAANNWERFDMDEQIDFALAFFQSAYHLRDYLLRDQAVTRQDLDSLFASTQPLRVCRDLCNGSKHRDVTSPSVDPEPWILRQYVPPDGARLVVKAGELFDLVFLADSCMGAWDAFLRDRGLDPAGLRARDAL